MTKKTDHAARDNSVQFALAELEALEQQRQRDEAEAAQAAERARQEAAEAAERARQEAAAQAAREAAVAREEARLNVDAQVAAKTEASDRKLDAMRAELERIRAERELIHRRMLTGELEPPRRPGRHWPVVAGLLGTTASVLGVLLFVQATTPAPEPEVIIREVHIPVAAPAEPATAEPAPETEPAADTTAAETADAPTATEARPTRRPRPRPQPRPSSTEQTLDAVSDCGDDPLCGL